MADSCARCAQPIDRSARPRSAYCTTQCQNAQASHLGCNMSKGAKPLHTDPASALVDRVVIKESG